MSLTIERTVLTQLVSNEEYTRKVLPFLKGDYFSDKSERIVFEEITKFVDKYNKVPTKTSLEIEVQSRKDLNEADFKSVISLVKGIQNLLKITLQKCNHSLTHTLGSYLLSKVQQLMHRQLKYVLEIT